MAHSGYRALLDEHYDLHEAKSKGYGSDRDTMSNFTGVSVATGKPRSYYPVLRLIEKAVRAINLMDAGETGDALGEELCDIAVLADCGELMRRDDERERQEAAAVRTAEPGASAPDRREVEREASGAQGARTEHRASVPYEVPAVVRLGS